MKRYSCLFAFLILLACGSCSKQSKDQALSLGPKKQYEIKYIDSSILIDGRLNEVAWKSADPVGEFQFPWWKEGKKEGTAAKMLWDDNYLYVSFVCEDEHIWAEHEERDSPVYRDDCVEVFISPNPDSLNQYYNVEMNVKGVSLDFYHANVGSKEPWDPELRIATSIEGTLNDDSDVDRFWILEVAIPFEAYSNVAKNTPPLAGNEWRLNLNRLGGQTNPQHSQWSPSRTAEVSFHAPEFFGEVIFVK
jgi:hypothetical protein